MKHLTPRIFNKIFKETHPALDIEIVRSPHGYYYFDGKDGFDVIPSLMVYDLDGMGYDCIENHILEHIKEKKMEAEIKIFSKIGHTPLTHREGNYCDLLVDTVIEVDDVEEAREKGIQILKNTEDAYKGFYFCPEEPNQNIRCGYFNFLD